MTTSFDLEQLETRTLLAVSPAFAHTLFRLPKALTPDVVDVLGDTAIFAGGFTHDAKGQSTGPSRVVYFFDAAKRRWSTGQLPRAIQYTTETVVGNQMLFAGGFDNGAYTDAVNIYTARTHRWSTAKLSVARGGMAETTVGNLAMFAGGSIDGGRSSDVVDLYNARTGRWSRATLPVARTGIAAVTVGRLALFAGGSRKGVQVSDEVDIFDSKTGHWSVAHLSSEGFCYATSVGHYALFEHLTNFRILSGPSEVDVYDASRNTWSVVDLPDFPYDVQTVGKYAVFADGIEPGAGDLGVNSPLVHIFNSETGQFTTTQLPVTVSNIGITGVAGRYMLFAGGEDEQRKETDKVYVLDAETGRWSTGGKLSSPREAMDAFTIGNTAYFADGWLSGTGEPVSDAMDAYGLLV